MKESNEHGTCRWNGHRIIKKDIQQMLQRDCEIINKLNWCLSRTKFFVADNGLKNILVTFLSNFGHEKLLKIFHFSTVS